MTESTARRTLIYVPITHSQEDMGSLGKHLPADQIRLRRTRSHWMAIQSQIQALALDWPRVKVYQDGLPDAGPEMVRRILTEVQSPNYDLLRWLVDRGAELIGTESPSLLKEEYEHLQALFTAGDDAARVRARRAYEERAGTLLAERDAYISRRIAETLPSASVGILFVGQSHRVRDHFPSEFVIQDLFPDQTSALRSNPRHS